MFGKKSEKQIYNQGLEKGKALQESEDIRKYNLEKEKLINHYEEEIEGLKFDLMCSESEKKTLEAENKRLVTDSVQVKKDKSLVKREWNRIDVFKKTMLDKVEDASAKAMLPYQEIRALLQQAPEKDEALEGK